MINLIVATDNNGMIAKDSQIPWHCKSDFRHFKETTMGHPMIMGRKTFESLPGVLPGRQHVVMTRDKSLNLRDDIIVCNSYLDAVERSLQVSSEEIFVIGGAQIYEESMLSQKYPVDKIIRSMININIDPDESSLYFRPKNNYKIVSMQPREDFTLIIYDRQ